MNWKRGYDVFEPERFINTCVYLRCGILGSSEFQRLIEKPTLEVSGTRAQRGALVWVSWNTINIFVSIQYFWYPKVRKAIHPPHLGLQDKGDKIFIFHNSDEELVEEEGDQLIITCVKLRSLFFALL